MSPSCGSSAAGTRACAGGASGRLKGGRHLRHPKNTPMANLLLAMLDRLEVPTEKFGDSNGKVDELFEPVGV